MLQDQGRATESQQLNQESRLKRRILEACFCRGVEENKQNPGPEHGQAEPEGREERERSQTPRDPQRFPCLGESLQSRREAHLVQQCQTNRKCVSQRVY